MTLNVVANQTSKCSTVYVSKCSTADWIMKTAKATEMWTEILPMTDQGIQQQLIISLLSTTLKGGLILDLISNIQTLIRRLRICQNLDRNVTDKTIFECILTGMLFPVNF